MVVIGLVGNKRVGKDTVADYLVSNYKFKKYAFADQIKKIAHTIFGWSENQLDGDNKDILDEELGIIPREFFEWFGTTIMQHSFDIRFQNNKLPPRAIWAYSILKQIHLDLETYIMKDYNIVITDFRFMHEFNLITSQIPEIKFLIIDNLSVGINQKIDNMSKSTYWQYEINEIINNIYNEDKQHHIIKNNSTFENLYLQIDTCMNDYNVLKHNYNINIKDAYFQ